ncbi:MAG TPA: spondin domain-containing protein [Blastocatellia bacterium]|nr:spondin domain-containing protein [Blastocatellia bacterium]
MKLQKLFIAIAAGVMMTASLIAYAHHNKDQEVKFTVKVENVSSKDLQTASDGSKWPFALSPGFWAVHKQEVRFFNEGKVMGPNGLEMQAEDGNPAGMVDFLMGHHSTMQHGVFNMPNGAETPGPIGPGGTYEFEFTAKPGMKLSLITMFGQSNDWFYAADPGGIKLFENGKPISGDITSKFFLWDAGTEKDEEPGIGPNQAPRQKAPNTGEAENGKVHKVKDAKYQGKNSQFFRVTISAQ